MTIGELVAALDFPGSQGLVLYGDGRAHLLTRGAGSVRFESLVELELFVEQQLKAKNRRGGAGVLQKVLAHGQTKDAKEEKEGVKQEDAEGEEEKVPRGAGTSVPATFSGFNQTDTPGENAS
jgi:hypothetical protein